MDERLLTRVGHYTRFATFDCVEGMQVPEPISQITWRYEGYSDIKVYVRAEVKGDPTAIAAAIRMASETNHSVVALKRALARWAATNRLSLRFIEGPSHDDPLAEHLGIAVFPGGEVAR